MRKARRNKQAKVGGNLPDPSMCYQIEVRSYTLHRWEWPDGAPTIISRLLAVSTQFFATDRQTDRQLNVPFVGTDYLWRIYTSDLDLNHSEMYVEQLRKAALSELDAQLSRLRAERDKLSKSRIKIEVLDGRY